MVCILLYVEKKEEEEEERNVVTVPVTFTSLRLVCMVPAFLTVCTFSKVL